MEGRLVSAPLVMNAADLRALASGLDALSRAKREFGIGPCAHSPEISIDTYDDTLSFHVDWRDVDGLEQYVLDDRYGS
jgi:hypothetical protein